MDLPTDVTDDQKSDEEFLRKVHHVLLEVRNFLVMEKQWKNDDYE